MQGGVIGGIALLVFLLSISQAKDIDISKQLEEDQNSLKTSDNLNNTTILDEIVDAKESNITQERSKPNLETQQNVKDSSTSLENPNKQIEPESLTSNNGSLQPKINLEPILPAQLPQNAGSYVMNSKLKPLERLPLISAPGDNKVQNLYLKPKNLPSDLVSSPNIGKSFGNEIKYLSATDNDNVNKPGLGLLPPLYSDHLAYNIKKKAQDDPRNLRFSPVFSGDDNHFPAGGFTNVLNPVPKSEIIRPYSSITKRAYDDSRDDLKSDQIDQNIDESLLKESKNSYPYRPPTNRSNSTNSESGSRSGALYFPGQTLSFSNILTDYNQGSDPYSIEYRPDSLNTISGKAQSSAIVIEDAKSRVIWPNELIFPNKIPGAENVIQCTRENEMHHLWSPSLDCLVCICLSVYGGLEPRCAKCSGCRIPPRPPPVIPITLEPYTAYPINPETTTAQPVMPGGSCSPLPKNQVFTNPLNPCQECICYEAETMFGRIEVIIKCEDNFNCVLPPDHTTLAPIPDGPIPVPLPLCEKFPPYIKFPHPTERCKVCQCSVEISDYGVLEQKITCKHDPQCTPDEPIPVPSSLCDKYPPYVPFPHPTERCKVCQCSVELSASGVPEQMIICRYDPQCTPDEPATLCDKYPPYVPFPHPTERCKLCQCSVEFSDDGVPEQRITCTYNPQCGPITDRPIPVPTSLCDKYPPYVPFPHPTERCKVCQCSVELSYSGVPEQRITCRYDPQCGPITDRPIPPSLCDKYPPYVPFPHPTERCKVCQCSVELSETGVPEQMIICRYDPQCGPITERPIPVPSALCDKYPPYVPFPHPTDACKVCQCSVELSDFGVPEQRITCTYDPQCAPVTDRPIPLPSNLCDKYPPYVPFPHPTESCKVCQCSVELSASGVPEQMITCRYDPQCGPITNRPTPVPWPITDRPTPVPSLLCENYPAYVPFPHPTESCKLCQCSLELSDDGVPEEKIICIYDPQCAPVTDRPVPEPFSLCEKYPPYVPFPHPTENCKVCQCSVELSDSGVPEQKITCTYDPQCGPITDRPSPLISLCEKYPPYVPFHHPTESCKVCQCSVEISDSGVPEQRISCRYDPQCVLPPDVTTLAPITDRPIPVPSLLCEKYPPYVPFPHPTESCKVCHCSVELSDFGVPEQKITCTYDPQCVLPPDVSTLAPITDRPIPVPTYLCEKYPPYVPFPHPTERCKVCQCSVELSDDGVPEQRISCTYDPQCGPITDRPTPLPSLLCDKYPPYVPFPHPSERCKVCQCSVELSDSGVPEQIITCTYDRQCGPTDRPIPLPSPLCDKYPPYVTFQHPTERCKVCQCSVELSDSDVPERKIICKLDPKCVPKPPVPVPVHPYGPTTIEPIPWPPITTPAPPVTPVVPHWGPLPGPSPHDSCRPYPPNIQFQHPWDECQVCQCSEIKAKGIVNIEVNCFTKLSCCIELPDGVISATAEAISAVGNEDGQAMPIRIIKRPLTSGFISPQLTNTYNQNLGYPGSNAVVNNLGGYNSDDSQLAVANASIQNVNPEDFQYQGFAEASAIAQSSIGKPINQLSGLYQSANAYSDTNGLALTDPNIQYNTLLMNSPYKPILSTYKPPRQYDTYNEEETNQYKDPMDQKPSFGQYNPGVLQSQGFAQANAQYNKPIISTNKPSGIYNPHNSGSQNQYAQASAKYNGFIPSTLNSPAIYGPYNPHVSQNQISTSASASANAYNSGGSQNTLYSVANAAASSNQGYLPGQYQAAKAQSSVSNAGQSSSADAIAQTQNYSPYFQPGTLGANPIPNRPVGYPYQSNSNNANSQFLFNLKNADGVANGQYKLNPVNYIGNYDFNGQTDAINVLSPQSGYNPYISGYAQGSSLYGNRSKYEMSPKQPSGEYGSSNVQSSAQAFASTKTRDRSGAGFLEDLDESK